MKKCNLKLFDYNCKDCGIAFQGYEGSLRCQPCKKADQKKRWTAYSRKRGFKEIPKTPMVIINSKGLVIGGGGSGAELKNWFLSNTKINENRLKHIGSIRYYLNNKLEENILGYKFICYWIMFEENYSFENAVDLINTRSKGFGIKHTSNLSERERKTILNIFNATGLQKEIAERFGVSRGCVNHIKSGHAHSSITGKVYKKRYSSPERQQKILDIFKAEGTYSEIAKKFEVSWNQVEVIKSGKAYSKLTGKIKGNESNS